MEGQKEWQDGVKQDALDVLGEEDEEVAALVDELEAARIKGGAVLKAKPAPDWWAELMRQAQAKSKGTKSEPAQPLAEWARDLVRRTILGGEK